MELEIFSEDLTRFYVAEMILAIDSIHQYEYIHRDIKPDNFLFDVHGHIKLSDFGLCTGYETKQFSLLYERLVKGGREFDEKELSKSSEEKVGTWKKHRRIHAYSRVGTANYMAPEVLLRSKYSIECDFWSVGTIMYEMLFGGPPFAPPDNDDESQTYRNLLNWKETLRFPEQPKVSDDAIDFICNLCCAAEDRLKIREIKQHPFFKGIDWEHIRDKEAPFVPTLTSEVDTRYFEIAVPLRDTEPEGPRPSARKVFTAQDIPFIGYSYRGFDAASKLVALEEDLVARNLRNNKK